MRCGNRFLNCEAWYPREPACIIHKARTLNGVGGRVGGGTCGSGEEKGPDPVYFAMSGEILPLDTNSSSAEETPGRTWAQRPFPLQPGPDVSCGRRNVTGAARRGQALGQVQGHAPQSSRRLFLVPGQKRKKLELPPATVPLHSWLFLLLKAWDLVQLRERKMRRKEGGEGKQELLYFH